MVNKDEYISYEHKRRMCFEANRKSYLAYNSTVII